MSRIEATGIIATNPRHPPFQLASKPIEYPPDRTLLETVRSQPVPKDGRLVFVGWGAPLSLDDPNLRDRAQEDLTALRQVMKEKGIREVVLRTPDGSEEQVVTQTSVTMRSGAGQAPVLIEQGGTMTPRQFPVKNGVMSIQLASGENARDVLGQAVKQAPQGTRIEVRGSRATLRSDDEYYDSRNKEALRDIQALIAPKNLTVVLRDEAFPASVQTITKDTVTTAAAPRPAAAIEPIPHPNWPNGFWTRVPNGASIAATYEKLIAGDPDYRGKTFIVAQAYGDPSRPSYFEDLLEAPGAHGDWARDELKRLTALAAKHDLTIVLAGSLFGKFRETRAITKDGLVTIPLPPTMPILRQR